MQIQKWVEARCGPGALRPLLAKHTRAVSLPIVIGGWYDAGALLSVIEDVARAENLSVEAAVTPPERASSTTQADDLATVTGVLGLGEQKTGHRRRCHQA